MDKPIINMDIPGLTNVEDLTTLGNFVKELKGQGNLIVEVGTFCGRSSYVLSKNSVPGTIIFTLDPFQFKHKDVDSPKRIFLETKRKYNLDNVIQIPRLSPFRRWEKKKIDMLFIDGYHDFSTVLEELNFYILHCNKDAIICGHDYHITFAGVIHAVNSIAREYEFKVENYKSCIWRLRK